MSMAIRDKKFPTFTSKNFTIDISQDAYRARRGKESRPRSPQRKSDVLQLVEFIHHGNTPIRQLAVENLIPYSLSQPSIFKKNQLLPVRDLKLLVRDYAVSEYTLFIKDIQLKIQP
jgi:hypothetical protein